MPVLQLDDQRFSLKPGATRVGGGPDVEVLVPGAAPLTAIIDMGNGGAVIRRAAADSMVSVNGVPLADPTPLLHGDKVEIAGLELLFSDDAKGGATQYVSANDIASMVAQKKGGAGRPTAATGGRLVSLVDGKEYTIPDGGVSIGRDASCDVVVAQTEVSRKHASIAPAEAGYVIHDLSTNGVFVNGERVQGEKLLGRADVLRIGSEEFRFYADVAAAPAAAAPAAPVTPRPAVVPSPAPAAAPVEPVPVAAAPAPTPAPAPGPVTPPTPVEPERIAPVAPAIAATAPATYAAPTGDTRPVLATLEILNEGVNKGKRFEIRDPLVHVGRGAHNDIQVADESVSDSHAKLQRRGDEWYVIDIGSTNGTYVAGTRIADERKVEGSADLRFGGVKMAFRPTQVDTGEAGGTRVFTGITADAARVRTKPHSAPAAPPPAKKGIPAWVWAVAVVVVAAAVYFVLNR